MLLGLKKQSYKYDIWLLGNLDYKPNLFFPLRSMHSFNIYLLNAIRHWGYSGGQNSFCTQGVCIPENDSGSE